MKFSTKTVEKLLEATYKASKDLRPKIGYLKVEKVKVGKSELRVYCTLETPEGSKKVLVKYDGDKLWVEGPRWASLPLKNRIVYHFNK